MRTLRCSLLTLLTVAWCNALPAGVVLEPKAAPEWRVSEWINGDPGTLAAQRGKVVLIEFMQLWCPGCNEFSIPLFKEWQETYGSRDDVLVLSIHTVFEGHDVQGPERLREFVAEQGITHPVGIDAYRVPGDEIPITMDRYETGGTPHVAIVDKEGQLVFTHFGSFESEKIERLIDRLLVEDKKLIIQSTSRDDARKKNRNARRQQNKTKPPPQEPSDVPDAVLSGSYKLRFEQRSRSCGDLTPPLDVITQITATGDRIEAKFSRPYLGIRKLVANYDNVTGEIWGDLKRGAKNKNVTVDLTLQLTGRLDSSEPPNLEFEYYLEQVSEDGRADCTIEGGGSGARFNTR